jgi:hypothetical protein
MLLLKLKFSLGYILLCKLNVSTRIAIRLQYHHHTKHLKGRLKKIEKLRLKWEISVVYNTTHLLFRGPYDISMGCKDGLLRKHKRA